MAKNRPLRTVSPLADAPKTKKLTINNCYITGTHMRRKAKESAVALLHVHMTGTLNADVQKVMDWEKPSQGIPKGPLIGKLNCWNAIFTAAETELQFHLDQVSKFSFSRDFDDNGQPKRAINLHFDLISQNQESIAMVNDFFYEFGNAEGSLAIGYTMKIGLQEELELRSATYEGEAEEVDDDDQEELEETEDEELEYAAR